MIIRRWIKKLSTFLDVPLHEKTHEAQCQKDCLYFVVTA